MESDWIVKNTEILTKQYCGERRRLKTGAAASCPCHGVIESERLGLERNGKSWKRERCSTKDDPRCQSLFGIWWDHLSDGSTAGVSPSSSLRHSLVLVMSHGWWGCVWARSLLAPIAWQGWGLPHCCVCFSLQCNLEGLCLLPTDIPGAGVPAGLMAVFALQLAQLYSEKKQSFRVWKKRVVWSTSDDLTSCIAYAWSYPKVSCVLKTQQAMTLHSKRVYSTVSTLVTVQQWDNMNSSGCIGGSKLSKTWTSITQGKDLAQCHQLWWILKLFLVGPCCLT